MGQQLAGEELFFLVKCNLSFNAHSCQQQHQHQHHRQQKQQQNKLKNI